MTSGISLSSRTSHRFGTSSQGVAYYDDTEENLGMRGPRSESSVDIEAGGDGSFHVAYGVPGRSMTEVEKFTPLMIILS